MASFLSALNDRDDGYGGPRENRVRLALEVLTRVRAEVGDDFALGCRFLTEDCIPSGGTTEDAVYPYTGPSGYECMPQFISDRRGPFGRNVEAVARVRAAVRGAGLATPVIVTGGIHGFRQAEQIRARGQADIIGLARQSLADPDWFRKVRLGRGDEVRVCEYTNYCEALDQKHVPVTCKLWDRVGREEPGIRTTPDGRRRLVAPRWDPGQSSQSYPSTRNERS